MHKEGLCEEWPLSYKEILYRVGFRGSANSYCPVNLLSPLLQRKLFTREEFVMRRLYRKQQGKALCQPSKSKRKLFQVATVSTLTLLPGPPRMLVVRVAAVPSTGYSCQLLALLSSCCLQRLLPLLKAIENTLSG